MASSSSAPIHVLGGVGYSIFSSKRTGSSSVRTVFLGQGPSNGRFGSLPRPAFLKVNRFGGRRRSAGRLVHVVNEKVVGVDLGTTNSAVAAMEGGKPTIVKEVELLLSPEERAILQQNEAPDFSKIATIKWSPLHTLALSGQIPLMDKVIEFGIDIDAVDKDGYSALHKVVISKKEAVISHLLRKGASPHVRDRDGATPLHYAVQIGAMQTVKLLIKYKVDVNVADNEGWIPLHVAIQSQCRDIAKVLLVNGADKTRRNKDGKTPLDLSLCFGRDFKSYELAKLLKLVPADREA